MAQLYVVTYSYGPAEDQAVHRPAHRAYLNELLEQGLLKVAGPYTDEGAPGATLVFEADSAEQVEQALAQDPMNTGGAVLGHSIRAWRPSVGALN